MNWNESILTKTLEFYKEERMILISNTEENFGSLSDKLIEKYTKIFY